MNINNYIKTYTTNENDVVEHTTDYNFELGITEIYLNGQNIGYFQGCKVQYSYLVEEERAAGLTVWHLGNRVFTFNGPDIPKKLDAKITDDGNFKFYIEF